MSAVDGTCRDVLQYSDSQRKWRGVRDLNPRGPTDHRLSRPAPYQARRTPLKIRVQRET